MVECKYKSERPMCGVYRYRNVRDYCNALVAAINRKCKLVYIVPFGVCTKCIEYLLTIANLQGSSEWEIISPPEAPIV